MRGFTLEKIKRIDAMVEGKEMAISSFTKIIANLERDINYWNRRISRNKIVLKRLASAKERLTPRVKCEIPEKTADEEKPYECQLPF